MIRDDLASALSGALSAIGLDVPADSIELERPARREHGDWSSNVAMVNGKKNGRVPRELAGEIVADLAKALPAHVNSVEIAGPGFVNFRLDDTWLYDILTATVAAGVDAFGRSESGKGTHVNVEFVSANPNKPLHAGHARGAVYGDAVARLLEAVGYEVTREYYLNDRGVQMAVFAESLAARKAGKDVPENGYHGEYLVAWADEMPDDADALEWGRERAIKSHQDTLARVNVHHDVWFSERSLVDDGRIQGALNELTEGGHVFENDGATWLRTTDEGDDKDRVLIKADGDYTYITPDIAYHRDKLMRADELINVWGADHHGYIQRMKAAIGFLDGGADRLEIIITQLVELLKDGEPFRMSGRLGDMVAFDDIIDAIGGEATRFTYLTQSMDTRQTVDLDELAKKSMDNPVYYVQYATARIHQLAKNAAGADRPRGELADADLSLLTHERELEILRVLSGYGDIVEVAARERAPHKITTWLRELAAAFHGFYHDCYVVGDGVSPELTQARLWLCEAALIGLTAGLDLVGVSAPEEL
ncbi:MAG: arginine--tRNA ligase [Actinomycetota bacterium]